MRATIKALCFAPALVLAAACSKDKPADASLNNDLTLAAQARQTATMDSISAAERLNGANAANANALRSPAATAPAPVERRTSSTVHHVRRSSGGTVVSSGGGTVTEKNTKRDAAIGAVAGGVLGAATGHGLKGGIIGAAAGGILGGVIGNNVDVHKRPAP